VETGNLVDNGEDQETIKETEIMITLDLIAHSEAVEGEISGAKEEWVDIKRLS